MNVSAPSPVALLESALAASETHQQIQVAMLKRSQDVMKEQGAAMVEMLEQAGQLSLQPAHALDVCA